MQLVEQFISFLKEQKRKPSKLTVKNYKADINQFIRWFEERFKNSFDPNKATFQVVDLYKDSQSFSASSMERHLSSLRKFFNFLKLEGLVSQSPFGMENGKWKMENADPYRLKDFKDFLYVYNASHLTIKNYIIDIKQFFKWAEEVSGIENAWDTKEKNLLGKIDSSFIEEYKNRLLEQEFLPSTVNRKLSSLRKYFNWAQAEGLLSSRHAEFISASQVKTRSRNEFGPSALRLRLEEMTNNQVQDNTAVASQGEALQPRYSKIPPVRLAQKFANVFELVFDYLVIFPLAKLGETFEYTFWQIQGKPVFKPAGGDLAGSSSFGKNSSLSGILNTKYKILNTKISNISKSFFAPLSISTKSFPWHKKAWHHLRHTRPQWYKTYHSYPITHYFHLAILIIFMTAVGFAMYNAFASTPKNQAPTFAAAPVAPPRILSFQGRLTDSSDNPVTTAATAMRMAIYNDPTASGAALLWQEIVSVSPDTDGIFSILLGNNTAITQAIFAQNATLYLGVTVGSTPELTPRQQLATVAFATNAEVLQGLPPITDAGVTTNANAVLALNSSGTVSIAGTATTTFQAASGQLTIAGKPLLLQTNSGTGGNITLAPDGLGTIDLQKPIQNSSNNNNISTAVGALEVNDLLAILATSSGQSALTINQTSTGPLISASTSGTAKFTVDSSGNGYFAGNVGIGITTPAAKLDISDNSANPALKVSQAGAGLSASFPSAISAESGLKIGTAADSTVLHYTTAGAASADFNGLRVSNPGGYGSVRLDYLYVASAIYGLTNGSALLIETRGAGDLDLSTETGKIDLQDATYNSTSNNGGAVYVNDTFATSGNVGIGTTAPGAALDIRGLSGTLPAASISATSSFAALITDNSGVGDLFTASKSGATKFVITNAGNVGIGTNLPGSLLAVTDNSANPAVTVTQNGTGYSLDLPSATSSTTGLRLGNQVTAYYNLESSTKEFSISQNLKVDGGNIIFPITWGIISDLNGTMGIGRDVNGAFGDVNTYSNLKVDITSNGSGTSLWKTFSGPITLQTVTSGAVVLNAAGALTLSAGAASTLTLPSSSTTALNISSGLMDFDTTNSRVGIGTTAPLATLDIRGLSGTLPAATISATSSFASLITDNAGVGDLFTASKSGATKFVITNAGNVGIGTNLPTALFSVGASSQFQVNSSGVITAPTSTNTINSLVINSGALSGITTLNMSGILTNSSTGNALTLSGAGANLAFTGAGLAQITTASNQNLALMPGGTGGVGIGTTTPLAALDIRGSSGTIPAASISAVSSFASLIVDNSGVGDLFTASKSGAMKFVIQNSGNVGIATASAYEKLDVYGGSILVDRGHFKFNREAAPADTITYADSGIAGNLDGSYSYGVSFVTATGESGGTNSGVNVSVNLKKMTVSNIPLGSAAVIARKIYRTAAGGANPRKYVATISDNTTTTYTDNLADGGLGAAIPNQDGTAGSFYINDALAFYPGETNSYNFWAGLQAGLNSGGQATFNTGVGVAALKANTSGSSSTAVGALALTSNTTGGNDAFGFRALFSNSTGGSNVGLGSQALYRNNTGNHNIGIGANAEFGNNDGHRNTVIGSNAFVNGNNSHSDNIGIGYIVGDLVTTGSRNVLIGSNVATTMTTGSDNILIGYNVQPPAVDSTYKLNIGGTIYGDLSTDKIGIGTVTPLEALDITGNATVSGTLAVNTIKPLTGALNLQYKSGLNAWTNGLTLLDNSGSVGIGTASPLATLDLRGNLGTGPIASFSGRTSFAGLVVDNGLFTTDLGDLITASSSAYPGQTPSGGGDKRTQFRVTNQGTIYGRAFYDIDNSAYFLDPATTGNALLVNGSVGIGTTGPDRKLDVLDASNPQMRLTQADGTVYADFQMDSNGDLIMNVDGVSNQLVLDNGGNVGIGTTAPAAKLDVNGNATFNNNDLLNVSDIRGNNTNSYINFGDGGGYLDLYSTSRPIRLFPGNEQQTVQIGNVGSKLIVGNTVNDANPVNDIAVNGNQARGIGVERHTTANTAGVNLTVRSGGATSGATDKNGGDLYLASGISTGTGNSNIYLQTFPAGSTGTSDNTATTRLTILGSGNVGIGTTNPSTTLQVYKANASGVGPILSLASDGGAATTTAINFSPWLTRSGGASAAIIGQDDSNYSGNLLFQTALTGAEANTLATRMIINSSGNVGIGTTSPLARFDVRGDNGTTPAASVSAQTSFAALITDNSGVGDLFTASKSGATKFVVTNAGNVGIGTNLPGAMLSVSGGVGIGSSITTTTVGDGNLQVSGNVGIGGASPNGTYVLDVTGKIRASAGFNGRCVAGIWSNYGSLSSCDMDVAEIFPSSEDVASGDVLVIDQTATISATVKKSVSPYNSQLLGIVTTAPGIILGYNGSEVFVGGEANIYQSKLEAKRSPAVALNGRVPVKVSSENGPIQVGDPLTSSSTPGVAMKATKAGPIVAKALEGFGADGNTSEVCRRRNTTSEVEEEVPCGKILAFVNVSWYDPDVYITSTGNYSLALQGETLQTQSPSPFVLKDPFGNVIDRIGAFAEIAVANLRAGFINAQEITTNSLAVTADSVTIGGENLRDYIVRVVNESLDQLEIRSIRNSEIISPIASIDRLQTDFISPLASDSAIALSLDSSKFIVHSSNDASSSAVAVIDNQGNATFSGELQTNKLTTNQLTTDNATVGGTLRAKKIIADQIEGLNIQTSTLSAQYITNNYYDNFGLIANSASSSGIPNTQYDIQNTGFVDIASFSGQLAYVENLNAVTATFTQGLIALGPTSLNDVSVAGQLSIGTSLILADNSINVLGSDLKLQPLKQGGLSIMGGLVYIDTFGNIKVGGNAEFAKDVTVKGVLSANIISPIPGSDLSIQNSSGSALLTINSEGTATFSGQLRSNELLTNELTARKLSFGLVQPALAISNTELLATGSAGVATISAHQTEVTINNNFVTDKSLIYITPVGEPNVNTPYLIRQIPSGPALSGVEGSFTAGIQSPSNTGVSFNWLIIN